MRPAVSGALAGLLLLSGPEARAASVDDLVRAYPDALAGADERDLIWRDGTRMQLGEDRPQRSLAEQLRNGSILDQLRQVYPAGSAALPEDDPGRIRNKAFFDKMYGDCRAGEVVPHLVPVVWLPTRWGHTVRITSVNGVDRQLDAVSRELDRLPATDLSFLYPIGGTYACRPVADTGQTSMHGWGAAIDINTKFSDYWLWRRGAADGMPAYANHIPPQIVAVFEKFGFIWGGRWAHFDTMHFEYRPELLGVTPAPR